LFHPVFSLQGDSPSLLGTSDSTGSETTVGEVTMKEEEGFLLPSLEEDKTVGAECEDALAESLPRVS
jgi:hypothetical protein